MTHHSPPLSSLMNEVIHTSPTIGSNVEEVVWRNIRFLMWDIGGQDSLRSAWTTYFTNSEVSSSTGGSTVRAIIENLKLTD